MSKEGRSPNSRKRTPQHVSFGISPDEILDTVDTGDETQLRFRYQHAYGVILLLAALSYKKPYTALWCEHHEDLLGQRNDGCFDAYQIKTRRDGSWNLSDDALKDSLKRFVEVDQRFPGKIKEFFFVSNARYENSNAQNKSGRSPKKFLQVVKQTSSPNDLIPPFNLTFEELRSHCDCEPLSLMTVLKKLDFITGPGLDSFEAEIAQDHLPAIAECHALPASALARVRDELIALVYKASSLSIDDPARHWYGLNQDDNDNPTLQAKRIAPETVLSFIRENWLYLFNSAKDSPVLSGRLAETLNLYLVQSFKEDRVAKLDQAGETDSERSTLLHQVFVDLELKPRNDQPLPPLPQEKSKLLSFAELDRTLETSLRNGMSLSAMDCFLKEASSKMVIIGGPGQGKSTLSQYLAQVHRSILLKCEQELHRDTAGDLKPQRKFQPKIVRLPFRIVLKYFGQWLADGPPLNTVEAYIAEQIGKGASRPGEVDAPTVQEILKVYPTLIIFDGLDEVTEQVLCNRMLTCIEGFLAHAEQLGADMQVIATARPTGYRDQFTPKLYWHLELQPMSAEKVREYAACWTKLKEPIEEERRRIKETLEECFKESHTSSLLTTPLQVTIILLITRNGGRPPSQREELFQKYWTTILDREKSKTTGMIRTEDTILFGLHEHLGYLLHRNAGGKNVRSLFPIHEFEQIVYDFLRLKDSVSSLSAIQQQAALLVEEARTRLVLLVEPEPGFFGFEIRSLQEFFAGAYLIQEARDTQQRFDRLKAIAYSEHWRNVALFSAGRIVRDHGGEAFKILEEVCRPMDRDLPDTYLHRGAWLALDIAADGIFTKNNRNLQASTLEHALTVLQPAMTSKGQNLLTDSLQHLTSEDRRDILSKLLNQKLASLPLSCIPTALASVGRFIETKDLIRTLEVLLRTNKQEYIQQAINIGFQHRVNPKWLAQQLEKYWHLWANNQIKIDLQEWWDQDRRHTQRILSVLSLSEDQVSNLMDHLLLEMDLRSFRDTKIQLMENPRTSSEQIAIILDCINIFKSFRLPRLRWVELLFGESLKISHTKLLKNLEWMVDMLASSGSLATLDQLMERSDLMPQLRACLWIVYWHSHESTDTMITTFFVECRALSKRESILRFFQQWRGLFRPLFSLVQKNLMDDDWHALALIQPYLYTSAEISLDEQISEALVNNLGKLSYEEQLTIVLCGRYTPQHFPELASIAEKLGTNVDKLIESYTALVITSGFRVPSVVFREVFSEIEKSIIQSKRPQIIWWPLLHYSRALDRQATQQGLQLLHMLVAQLPQQRAILKDALYLFVKLLSSDTTTLLLAPALLSYLADEIHLQNLQIWRIVTSLLKCPKEHLKQLANFTTHEDPKVQQGAITLWATLLETKHLFGSKSELTILQYLHFDWKLNLSLIRDTNIAQRKKGILLLIYSHFPIKETHYLTELKNAMAQAEYGDEIEAWALFLENVPMGKQEKKAWQKLLEVLLDTPQSYSSHIIIAAIKRYTELVGIAGSEIKNEHALGLPVLVHSRER